MKFTRSPAVAATICIATLVLVMLAFAYRGHIRCGLFYAECSPFITLSEMPNWSIPTDQQARKQYDFAHSLSLPEEVANPAPFDFKSARLKSLYGGHSVAQQYFEHLCATESRDYVFQRVHHVDGFLLMRPRPATEHSPANFDRFGIEEPVGLGWESDDDQLHDGSASVLDSVEREYIQPFRGTYEWVEYPDPLHPNAYIRLERLKGPWNGSTERTWGHWAGMSVPYVAAPRRPVAEVSARFGYTRRGIRRQRDREFGIAGADFLVVDLSSNTVLGLRRTFNSSYNPRHPEATNWASARSCTPLTTPISPVSKFVMRVLNPRLNVNDEFLPADQLVGYHSSLLHLMETGRVK